MADPLANTSFTRSLYIGTDKTAEVLKRKEAAEKELMARREAKMREQEERLARAKQQKEEELRERIRHRQQRELERQKAVLDRRCAQLEKQNAKKEEILLRNHQKASRTANSPQKKPVYAFGSSTPRELSYLEKLNHQQQERARNGSVSRGTTPTMLQNVKPDHAKQEPGAPNGRMPSRFLVPTTGAPRTAHQPPGSSSMTRSVFGALNGNGGSRGASSASSSAVSTQNSARKVQKTAVKQKPAALKRQVQQQQTLPANSAMTQSLYVQSPRGKQTKRMGMGNGVQGPRRSPRQAASNKVGPSKQAVKQEQEEPKPRPVIRPRKAQQKQQAMGNGVVGDDSNGPPQLGGTAAAVIPDNNLGQPQPEEEHVHHVAAVPVPAMDVEMAMEQQNEPQPAATEAIVAVNLIDQPIKVELPEPPVEGGDEDEETPRAPVNDQFDPHGLLAEMNMLGDGQQPNAPSLQQELEEAMNSGGTQPNETNTGFAQQQEKPTAEESIFLDQTGSTLVQGEQDASFGNSSDDSGDKTLILDTMPVLTAGQYSPENGEPPAKQSEQQAQELPSPPKSTSPNSNLNAAPKILSPEHDEQREMRKQKLNEILQKTRNAGGAAASTGGVSPVGVASSGSAGGFSSSNGTSAAGKVTPSATLTSLVTGVENPLLISNIDPTSFAKELLAQRRQQKMQQQQQQNSLENNNMTMSMAASNTMAQSPQFFQLPGQIHDQPIPAYQPPTSLTVLARNDSTSNGHDATGTNPALKTPPEDPHMNNLGDEQENGNQHPPEPTLIDFS